MLHPSLNLAEELLWEEIATRKYICRGRCLVLLCCLVGFGSGVAVLRRLAQPSSALTLASPDTGERVVSDSKQGLRDAATTGGVLAYIRQAYHKVQIRKDGMELAVASQGPKQWQATLGSTGAHNRAAVVASRLGGGPLTYSIDYDVAKGSLLRRLPKGVKKISVSGAGDTSSSANATMDQGDLAYDGVLAAEQPITKGLSARFALDLKRRVGTGSLAPPWARSSVGLRQSTPNGGNVWLNLYRPNPDAPEQGNMYEAMYSNKKKGSPPGPLVYQVRALGRKNASLVYDANIRLQPCAGVQGQLEVVAGGGEQPTVTGAGEFFAEKKLGVVALGAKAAGVAVPLGMRPDEGDDAALKMYPVVGQATADLAALAPAVVARDSRATVRVSYDVLRRKPVMVEYSAKLNAKQVGPVRLGMEGVIVQNPEGSTGATVAATASVGAFKAAYWGQTEGGFRLRHVGQVVLPFLRRGDKIANIYGRVTRSSDDHAGRPRIQFGLQYSLGGAAHGESAIYDTGSQLIDAEGRPWTVTRFNNFSRPQNIAKLLRRRIAGSRGLGYRWLADDAPQLQIPRGR